MNPRAITAGMQRAIDRQPALRMPTPTIPADAPHCDRNRPRTARTAKQHTEPQKTTINETIPHPQNTRQTPELERPAGDAALGARQTETDHPGRILVRVTSVRKRLLDEDNLAEKYHVDCCRYAGLIPGDAPDQIRIETTQRKAAKGEPEHTVIELFPDEGRALLAGLNPTPPA